MISNESINSIFLANQYVDENMGREDILNLANLQDGENQSTKNSNNVIVQNIHSFNLSGSR